MRISSTIRILLTACFSVALLGVGPGCKAKPATVRYDSYAALAREASLLKQDPKQTAQKTANTNRAPVRVTPRTVQPAAGTNAAKSAETRAPLSAQPRPQSTQRPATNAPSQKSSAPVAARPQGTTNRSSVASRPAPATPSRPAAQPAGTPPEKKPAPPPVQVVAPPPVSPAAHDYTPNAENANPYVLNVDDVVQITLLGIPNSERMEMIIYSDGMLSLPFIKPVKAVGLTAAELEQAIRNQYIEQKIYQDITVNVVVPARFYFMQGEIRQPGRYQLVKAMRVSQAIAGAGGFTEFRGRKATISRNGKIYTIRNVHKLDRTPEDDILIEPDDIIKVERSIF